MTDKQEIGDESKDSALVPQGPVEVAQFGARQAYNADFLSGKAGYDYLRFVLNPDIERPVRMPTGYSYPSALVSWKNNFTLTTGALNDFCGYFAPQNILSNQNVSGQYVSDYFFVVRSSSPALTPPFNTRLWNELMSPASFDYYTGNYAGFPYKTLFDAARVVAAKLEIVYMGALQSTSGTYIISANILGANSLAQGSGAGVSPGVPGVNSPPTVNQQFNERIVKKYMGGDTVSAVWFPVDWSCSKFQGVGGVANPTGTIANFSQLVFYINGYGFPPGAQFDVRIQVYYEAVPNMANSNQFVGMQSGVCDDWKVQWDQINQVARDDLGRLLLTGVKAPN